MLTKTPAAHLTTVFFALLACLVCITGHAETGDRALTLKSVLQNILATHPDLELNAVDVSIAGTASDQIDARLDPELSGRVGLRDDQVPVISDFQAAETNFLDATGTVVRPATNGSTLSATIDYSRTYQGFQSPFAAQLAKFNPAYRGSISLQYRYPLFRGSGRPDYREGLAAADAERRALTVQRRLIARMLSLEGLQQYFQLLSDGINVRIAEVAVDRAGRLLDYQRFREQFGLVERADRVQAEALVATRKLELESAQARQTLDRVSLNRLMHRSPDRPLLALIDRRRLIAGRHTYPDSIAAAMKNRPEFDVLDARRDAAKARLRQAQDGERPQLDVVAELGTLSLDDNVGTSLARSLSPDDRFAGVALELSDRVGRKSAKADVRKAELDLQRIDVERRQADERVRDEVAAALTTLSTGDETLRLARARADAENRKFEAEMSRYREGRSDTATILQFESELHAAELQADQQELALLLADRQMVWALGNLLDRLEIELPEANSSTR